MSILIHAGAPRTGTTSIAHALSRETGRLHGLGYHYYSGKAGPVTLHHDEFAKCLYDGHLLAARRLLQLAQDEAGGKVAVLVVPSLYLLWTRLPEASVRWLREQAHDLGIRASVSVREPIGFLRSLYGHCVRQPHKPGLPEFGTDLSLEEFCGLPQIAQAADYANRVKDIEGVFTGTTVLEYDAGGMVNSFFFCVLGDTGGRVDETWQNCLPY